MEYDDAIERERVRRRLLARTSAGGPITLGLLAMLALFGSFGVWASTAPISGAAVAQGSFVARGQNRTIQHLEGGIIEAILVDEGARVSAGDELIRLDATQPRATLQRLTAEFDTVLAREARLVAEREGADRLVFSEALLKRSASEPSVAEQMADQEAEFAAKRERFQAETAVLEQKIKALEEEISGHKAQREAISSQLALVEEELADLQALFEKRLTAQERLLALRRTASQLQGKDGELIAASGKAEQTILENRQQIIRLETERVEEAATGLVELRVEKAKLQNEIAAAADILARVAVRTPMDGIVVKVHVNTIGGVLEQGASVVDILPLPADLVVEARLDPVDIDRVSPGQDASVRIPALHIPYSPAIPAKVEYVSADRFVDEDSNEVYYLARIGAIELPADIEPERLYPGMQVEAFIATEPRTFLEYLVEPVLQSFQRSLREQ